MKALIAPDEKIYSYAGPLLGERVAQVQATPFDVAPPFFWVSCSDNVVADLFYYDPSTRNILPVPMPPSIQAGFSPNPVQVGAETTLTWSVFDATAVMLSSYGSQQFPLSGSQKYIYQAAGSHQEIVTGISPNGNLPQITFVQVAATQEELSSSGNAPISVI